MSALGQLAGLAARMAEAMGRKNIRHFGQLIDAAWALNQQLDPQSTTPEIEELLSRIRTHLYGAKLLGAGGGGFLLLIARSQADADASPAFWKSRHPMTAHDSSSSRSATQGWR